MYKRNFEPNYEAALGTVRHFDNDNLRDFVNNDESVDNFVKNVDQCKELETEKEMIMAQNKSLAEYNLSLAPKLEKGKARLKELSPQIQAICDSVQEKQSRLRNHSGNLSVDTALALLQAAAAESEEESEKIAEKFYHKEIEIQEFLDQFQAVRKQMHLRRVKTDKMNDLMSKKPIQTSGNFTGPSRPPPPVPYPVGPTNMPFLPK